MARKLVVEVIGDADHLNKTLKQAGNNTSTFGSKLKSLGKTGALAGGAAGIGAVALTLKAGIGEYIETTKVAAQTQAVIKATGAAAHVTAKHVDDLANSLLHTSGVDDELIKSGQNVLLTFKSIRNEVGKGNDIFDQATKATLDLSVATGKSLPSAARLVGRALQDPIKGMGALKRVGVQLTEAQEDQVKAFIKSGDTMKAQKIILGELNDRVGGSAKALGQTLPGQINIVRESFNNWAGELVARMIPVLERMVKWVKEHWPEIRKTIIAAWVAIKPTLVALAQLVGAVVKVFIDHWPQIKPIVMGVVRIIKAQLAIITPAMQLLADLLRGDWSKAWGHFKQVIVNVMRFVKLIIKSEVKAILAILKGLGTALVNLIVRPINAVIDKINAIKIGKVKIRGAPDIPGFDPIPDIPRIPTIGGGGGGGTTVVHTTVNLDGKKVAENVTKHQQRAAKNNSASRRGRNAGTGLLAH